MEIGTGGLTTKITTARPSTPVANCSASTTVRPRPTSKTTSAKDGANYRRIDMIQRAKTAYERALHQHLVRQGWSQEEIDWADENPYIRQAIKSFAAGWKARTDMDEVNE